MSHEHVASDVHSHKLRYYSQLRKENDKHRANMRESAKPRQPIWLKFFFSFLFCYLLHPGKTACHAPQRMEHSGVPDGWLQIIRGPRPPAAKWPRAKVQTPMQQKPHCDCCATGRFDASKLQDRPRRSPAEVRAVASTKILRIQAAIASLGADDIEERSSLEAALSRAQRLFVIPPVDKRIEDTSAFIARKKKCSPKKKV